MGGQGFRKFSQPTSRKEWTKADLMKYPESYAQYIAGDRRPTLAELIKNDGSTYNDARDGAWINSIGGLRGREKGTIYRYGDFKHALFCLESLSFELDVDNETMKAKSEAMFREKHGNQ